MFQDQESIQVIAALKKMRHDFGDDVFASTRFRALLGDFLPGVQPNKKRLITMSCECGAYTMIVKASTSTVNYAYEQARLKLIEDYMLAEEAAYQAIAWIMEVCGYESPAQPAGRSSASSYAAPAPTKGKTKVIIEGLGSSPVEYEGELFGGKPHGKGVATLKDGSTLEATFDGGKLSGDVICHYTNGSVYEGAFAKGNPHGRGVLRYADGSKYEGEFSDGRFHGKGAYRRSDGDVYDGEWKNHMRHGRGEYRWTSGARYTGEWVDGKRHGKGVQVYANGDEYDGEWRNSERHGSGVLTSANGNVVRGRWENDKHVTPPTQTPTTTTTTSYGNNNGYQSNQSNGWNSSAQNYGGYSSADSGYGMYTVGCRSMMMTPFGFVTCVASANFEMNGSKFVVMRTEDGSAYYSYIYMNGMLTPTYPQIHAAVMAYCISQGLLR